MSETTDLEKLFNVWPVEAGEKLRQTFAAKNSHITTLTTELERCRAKNAELKAIVEGIHRRMNLNCNLVDTGISTMAYVTSCEKKIAELTGSEARMRAALEKIRAKISSTEDSATSDANVLFEINEIVSNILSTPSPAASSIEGLLSALEKIKSLTENIPIITCEIVHEEAKLALSDFARATKGESI